MNDEKYVRLIEQGSGFPDRGDYVSWDGHLYKVVGCSGHVHTENRAGSYVFGTVTAADWSDCPEGDERQCRVELVI